MDWEDSLPMFALAALAGLALALKALFDARRVRLELAGLTEKFWMLDHRMIRLAERLDGLAPGAPLAETEAAPESVTPPAIEPEPVVEETPLPETAAAMASEAAAAEPGRAEPAGAPPLPSPAGRGWEQALAEHWLVWLGGATIALGGVFLVKLSIDYGLLTPSVRVVLGVALGVGLSAGGEWLRRRDLAEAGVFTEEAGEDGAVALASYVPQALSAAGAATVFASFWAAYQLYGMLPAGAAFVLLAATAVATVAQSLKQGPYVAALGLVGAYAVPLLVSSDAPHALPLFAYLAVVTAASLALLRHRAWWWLAWLCLSGAIGWVLLWLGVARDPETPVLALYLAALFGTVVGFRHGVPRVGFLAGLADTPMVRAVTRTAFWALAFGLFLLAHADAFGTISIATSVLAVIGLMVFANRDPALDDVVAVAGALPIALLASWSLPHTAPEMALSVFRVQPDQVANFSVAAIVFAALLGGGFALLPRVPRPGRWAAVSAAAPLLILVIAYWRLQSFELNVAWTLTALALAGAELGAANWVVRRRDGEREWEIALAAYAVGVLGSTIFAATVVLGDAWLTVALALHLPALGWIESRIRLKALRWIALRLAAVVLIRLVLNPYVLDYPLGTTPIFNWLLYGYGIPAFAFIAATRLFGDREDDALVWVLEAGSTVFTLLLLTLELVHAIYGRLTFGFIDDFPAGAALIALWFVFAGALLALAEFRQRPVLRWAGWILLGITTPLAAFWQLVMLVFGSRVGDLLILDGLLLADAVPAAVFAFVAWLNPHRPVLRMLARILAALCGLAWVTLEIRHAFHARVEVFGRSSEAEWYLYSVAWLGFAGAALAFGLLRNNPWLRQAGLIGIGLVIAKVFLSDMAALSGVLRALSFLGLGGALVGIGYAYRRMRPLQQPPSLAAQGQTTPG